MRVLVLGASGKTGRQLVTQGLDRGHAVTAFVREPARLGIPHPHLSTVQGNVGDYASVSMAVAGHDAVLSALGVGSPLKTDPIVIDGVRHVVRAMAEHGVRRLVYMSFIGVGDSRAASGLIVRCIAVWPLAREIRDHAIKEDAITSSRLDWTIVRPPTLTNGPLTNAYRSGPDVAARSLLPMLSRADVAACILEQLTDPTSVHRILRVQPR